MGLLLASGVRCSRELYVYTGANLYSWVIFSEVRNSATYIMEINNPPRFLNSFAESEAKSRLKYVLSQNNQGRASEMEQSDKHHRYLCRVIPLSQQRISSRTPEDTKIHRYSSPLHKMAWYLHIAHAHPPGT